MTDDIKERPRTDLKITRAVAVARREGFSDMIHFQTMLSLGIKVALCRNLDSGHLHFCTWTLGERCRDDERKTPPGDSCSLGVATGSGCSFGSARSFLSCKYEFTFFNSCVQWVAYSTISAPLVSSRISPPPVFYSLNPNDSIL